MTKDNLSDDTDNNGFNSLNKSKDKHLHNSTYKNNSKDGKISNFIYDGLSSLVPGSGELYNTLYINSAEDKKLE